MSDNSTNIGNLISPDILAKVGGGNITNFGITKSNATTAVTGQIASLKDQIQEVADQQKLAASNYSANKSKLDSDYQSGKITKDEYNQKSQQYDTDYQNTVSDLNNQSSNLQQQLSQEVDGPYSEVNSATSQLNSSITSDNASMAASQAAAAASRAIASLQAGAGNLALAIGIPLVELILKVVLNNKKLQKLVDDTNAVITTAHTEGQLQQARIKRDSALNLLNNQYNSINSIENTLQTIEITISIINTIISILSSLPTPAALVISKYQQIVAALTVILAAITQALKSELETIIDLKNELDQLGTVLDNNVSSSPNFQAILDSLKIQNSQSNMFPSYKGFTFAIKEDNTPGYEIQGNKRHYAVALNKDGVIMLKSDVSFTTDYNVLIDQLKLYIDSQNLQS